MSSNAVPSASMVYADWAQLLVASWGTLVVEINPFANFQAAIIGARAMHSLDVALLRRAAFSVATSIT